MLFTSNLNDKPRKANLNAISDALNAICVISGGNSSRLQTEVDKSKSKCNQVVIVTHPISNLFSQTF